MHLIFIMPPQDLCENTSPTTIERKGNDMERHRDLYKTKQSICDKGNFSVQLCPVLR